MKKDLVPVKLLPSGSDRSRLLRVIGEKSSTINKNDYIEKLAGASFNNKPGHAAVHLLALENASEIAKKYLHAPGLFEQIMKDIIGTRGYISHQIKTTKNNLNIQRKKYPQDHHENFILVSETFGNGSGHYGLIHLQHQNGKVRVYDSMYGDGASKFQNVAQKWTKTRSENRASATSWDIPAVRSIFGCKAKVHNLASGNINTIQVQPSGGFVSSNYTNFLNENYNGTGRNGFGKQIENLYGKVVAKGAFRLSQFDELSQHHFCYMESIYAMMLAIGLTKNPGPNDPRKRISFIKKFIWGMVHKYTPRSKRTTPEWKYFTKVFPHIAFTTSKTGKPLRLWRGNIQLPDSDGTFRTVTRAATWMGYDKIDPSWSITDVLTWVHTGRTSQGNRNANSNSNSNSNNNNKVFAAGRRPTRSEKRTIDPNYNSNNNRSPTPSPKSKTPNSATPKSKTPKSATPKSSTPKSKTPPKTRRPTTRSMKPK